MTPSRFAVGLVGIALAGLWYFAGGTEPLPESSAADASSRVAAPVAHENLSVYFLYGPDTMADTKLMSLQEALERELAVVHETSNVNVLSVENRSPDTELFIQSGDIVKGGKQDRMAQMDMLLPPNSGVVALPAHCVEQGRWTGRGAEDTARFKSSAKCAVGNEMKIANYNGQQNVVWEKVSENQRKYSENVGVVVNSPASPTSFQLALESPALAAKVAEYEAALKAAGEERAGVVGVVFVVNGQMTGAEVYGSSALFRKAWPKLLNAAAVEAVAERTDKATAAAPSAREIERFLASGGTAEPAGSGSSTAARGQMTMGNFVANANEEVFQTEGWVVVAGHGPGGTGASAPVQTEGRPGQAAVYFQQQAVSQTPTNLNFNRPFTETTTTAPVTRPVLPAGTLTATGVGQAEPLPPPPNTDGNRLNSNRTENRSTLVVESRDAGRQNAVIHRSYLKK